MKRILNILLLLLVTILLTGCVSRREILQFQQDHLQIIAQQERIEADINELEARLDTLFALLGGDVSQHFASQERILRGIRADQQAVNSQLQSMIQSLGTRISESSIYSEMLQQKLDEVNLLIAQWMAANDTTQAHAYALDDPEQLYNQSYMDLTQGSPDLARYGFEQYLQLYPNTSLADNALYWLGETYLAEGSQDSARYYFEQVESRYPDSNKLAASWLKRGIIHAGSNEQEQARQLFDRILSEFPDSEEATQAQIRLRELQ